jgi:hypothetical protein
MKKHIATAALAVCLVLPFAACDMSNWVIPEETRVTFALVISTRIYNRKTVYAEVREGSQSGTLLEVVEAPFEDCPNTAADAWAKMTTLAPIMTNRRYRLDFYLDMDGNTVLNAGDLVGHQEFEVTPNASWSETKYFYEDLETVT